MTIVAAFNAAVVSVGALILGVPLVATIVCMLVAASLIAGASWVLVLTSLYVSAQAVLPAKLVCAASTRMPIVEKIRM